jgi:hypothetical protein
MNTFVNPMVADWTLTDGDTEQWGKMISISKYQFYHGESISYCRETPCNIDLNDYSAAGIENIISSYGYSLKPFSKDFILNLHSKQEASWLIAEAIYETNYMEPK